MQRKSLNKMFYSLVQFSSYKVNNILTFKSNGS